MSVRAGRDEPLRARSRPHLDALTGVEDPELVPPGRVVLVMLHDGTLLKGELIVATPGHYTVEDVTFEKWDVETIDDVS